MRKVAAVLLISLGLTGCNTFPELPPLGAKDPQTPQLLPAHQLNQPPYDSEAKRLVENNLLERARLLRNRAAIR